jgi:hypothetical protein
MDECDTFCTWFNYDNVFPEGITGRGAWAQSQLLCYSKVAHTSSRQQGTNLKSTGEPTNFLLQCNRKCVIKIFEGCAVAKWFATSSYSTKSFVYKAHFYPRSISVTDLFTSTSNAGKRLRKGTENNGPASIQHFRSNY